MKTMKKTYEDAVSVLALDAELMRQSASTLDVATNTSFASCNWLSRLWTFQEGILTTELFVQFCDGAVRVIDWLENPSLTDEYSTEGFLSATAVPSSLFSFNSLAYQPSLNFKRVRKANPAFKFPIYSPHHELVRLKDVFGFVLRVRRRAKRYAWQTC